MRSFSSPAGPRPILKYAELIYQMVAEGYSVYTVDNRGMGFSSRLADNPQMVHVEKFSDYVDDLKKFVDTVVKTKKHRKIFFVSHSMGGLITGHYMVRYPEDVDAAVFNSPLWEVNTGSIYESLAYSFAQAEVKAGRERSTRRPSTISLWRTRPDSTFKNPLIVRDVGRRRSTTGRGILPCFKVAEAINGSRKPSQPRGLSRRRR